MTTPADTARKARAARTLQKIIQYAILSALEVLTSSEVDRVLMRIGDQLAELKSILARQKGG